jgi:hypothetical protein
MSYLAPKMELRVKTYDGLIMLESSFQVQFSIQFSCFGIKMCYNLCHGTSELAEIWNLG